MNKQLFLLSIFLLSIKIAQGADIFSDARVIAVFRSSPEIKEYIGLLPSSERNLACKKVIEKGEQFPIGSYGLPYGREDGSLVTDFSDALILSWLKNYKNENERKDQLFQRLSNALEMEHFSLAEKWIGYGAEINKQDKDGKTVLFSAESPAVVQFLKEYRADFECKEYRQGHTALAYFCCYTLALGIIEELLIQGANPNAVDATGLTPLCYAFQQGDKKKINLLLSHGATINDCDGKGNSLLHLLAQGSLGQFRAKDPLVVMENALRTFTTAQVVVKVPCFDRSDTVMVNPSE